MEIRLWAAFSLSRRHVDFPTPAAKPGFGFSLEVLRRRDRQSVVKRGVRGQRAEPPSS